MSRNPLLPAAIALLSMLLAGNHPVGANPYVTSVCPGPPAVHGVDGWFSIPSRSWIGTAEDLCLAFGPAAASVFQFYPDTAGGGAPPVAYQYTCPVGATPGVCTPLGASPSPSEPGCATSKCFCVDDYEGFGVELGTVSAGFTVDGCYTGLPSPPLAAVSNYLTSVAPDNGLPSFDRLSIALNLVRTGMFRGTMTRLNCATGTFQVITAGTAVAMTTPLFPGEAYLIRNIIGFSYTNPVSAEPCACTETAFYDIIGVGDATDYAWWVDDGKNGLFAATEVYDATVPGSPTGAPAGDLAQNLVDSINFMFGGATCTAAMVTGSSARISVTCTPCSFDLYVAPAAAGPPPFPGQCPLVTSACSYNPTIRKVFPQQDAGEVEATLRVDPAAGGDLSLAWGNSCLDGDTDYAVYEGTVGDWDSHTSVQCTTAGISSTTLTPQAADSYYLVVPRNALYEGSYGRDSTGTMRPQGAAACAVQQAVPSCP